MDSGRGSEFVVRLPILSDTSRPLPQPVVREPMPAVGRRILIVDDNEDGAESLAMLLQFGGHETHMAHDGLEAIEAAGAASSRCRAARHRSAGVERL